MQPHNPFLDFMARYKDAPTDFIANVLQMPPDPWQQEVLEDIAAGERLISIRSGHGVGKSTALAMVTVWFACTRFPFKVVMTAPTAPQLYDALWAETKSLFRKLPASLRPLFELKSDRIVLASAPESGFISVRTSTKERPEALAGVHSENVLLIADEASAIPETVFESAQGSMSGHNAATILTGNPTRLSGLFYQTHHELADDWKIYHVSSFDSPRVDARFCEQIKKTYGENSNQFRVRVLGEFPLSEDDVLISRTVVEAAMKREIEVEDKGTRLWACDPARFGSDKTAICERVGSVVNWIEWKQGLSTMEVAGWLKYKYDKTPTDERPEEILVDVIGVGAGVVDRLFELRLPVRGINVAESALMFSDGAKLRDQLWLDLKMWLEAGVGKLPYDRGLMEDIVTPTYSFLSNGKLKVESKQEMRHRGKPSPDLADCVVLTFASEPAVLASGRGKVGWNKPLKRGLVSYG